MNSDVSKRSKNLFCGRPYDPPGTFQAPMGGGLNSKMTGKWALLEGTFRRKLASNGRLHNHSQKLQTQRNQIAGRMPKTALEPRATHRKNHRRILDSMKKTQTSDRKITKRKMLILVLSLPLWMIGGVHAARRGKQSGSGVKPPQSPQPVRRCRIQAST